MKKISSGFTFFHKKIFPLFWFGFIAVFVANVWTLGKGLPKDPMFIAVPIIMLLIGFVILKKLVWDLMDEVYDGGDYLLVKNRGEEERIPLSNIMNVSASTFTNPPRVTLRLVRPGKFGEELTFSPVKKFSLSPFAKHPMIDDLIRRVDQARVMRAIDQRVGR